MYQIKDYSYVQADRLNVIIKPSTKKFKKIDVFNKKNEYITSIGDNRYKDFPTYIQEKGVEYALKRRDLYRIRHKGENENKNTAGYYSWFILW